MPRPLPTKTLMIPDVGPVLLAKSPRAKRIRITIKPDRTVTLTVPKAMSAAGAKEFLESKSQWIKKHLNRLRNLRPANPPIPLPPLNKAKAKNLLTRRIAQLARTHGFTYNKLFIRNQKTRWGTCSSLNNISLNMNLISLPDHLQEYVILHELVHTRHKNHGPKFWSAMQKFLPDAKLRRKQMRQYALQLDRQ